MAFLLGGLCSGLAAQTVDTEKRIADLERQVEALRAQVQELKAATVHASAPAAVPAIADAPALAAASPVPADANPLASVPRMLDGVTFSGLLDTYYTYNANHPAALYPYYPGVTYNATTPFNAVGGQIGLNLLELQLDKPVEKRSPLGFRVALGWGQAISAMSHATTAAGKPADLAVSALPGAADYLKEAYASLYLSVGKGVQLDVGKFVTPAGVEMVESHQNWNYTRGLLFTYALPYYHFGARAKYIFNERWSVTGFLTNGWNNIASSNSGKTGGLSLTWTPNRKFALTGNYLGGPRDIWQTGDNAAWNHLYDVVGVFTPTAKFSVAGEFDYDAQALPGNTHASYAGMAVFAKYQATRNAALALRYEFLNDHAGLGTGIRQHLNGVTLTVERKVMEHVLTRLEYRRDQANKTFFQVGKNGSSEHQDSVTLGLIYVLEAPAK